MSPTAETGGGRTRGGGEPPELQRVRELFRQAAFVTHLGIELLALEPGSADTVLAIEPRHAQAEGVVHAGVQATMADHTAGAAATTLLPADKVALTLEFKLNLLRPARGERLRCHAEVLRPGRSFSVVLAKVYSGQDAGEALATIATVTLAVVQDPRPRAPSA